MEKFVPIEGKTLHRDTGNMALLETDVKVKNEYLNKKRLVQENKEMKEKINFLLVEMEEIKRLLKEK